jgi:hypothetical protein
MGEWLFMVMGVVPATIGVASVLLGWRYKRDDVGCIGIGMMLIGFAVFAVWWFFARVFTFVR